MPFSPEVLSALSRSISNASAPRCRTAISGDCQYHYCSAQEVVAFARESFACDVVLSFATNSVSLAPDFVAA